MKRSRHPSMKEKNVSTPAQRPRMAHESKWIDPIEPTASSIEESPLENKTKGKERQGSDVTLKEEFDWFPTDEDDIELLFDSPVYINNPTLRPRSIHERPFQGHSFAFHGNYRRFLVVLFLGLFSLGPLLYLGLQHLQFAHSISWTLCGLTVMGSTACIAFYFASYTRRGFILDDFGFSYKDELREVFVGWDEVKSIRLHAVEAFFNPYPLCYVRISTHPGDVFGFANFGNHLFGIQRKVSFGNPPYPIIDVRDSDLLLSLLTQQARTAEEAPDLKRLRFRAQNELELEKDSPEELRKTLQKPEEEKPFYFGLWALFIKIGSKVVPQGLKMMVKTVKPLYAGASVGIYAIFFKWEFAFILVLILVVHELGHVWAMYRAGMRIRGVYLIPFFGAATVTDDIWPSWETLAKVNLAGPLWGTYMTGACLLIYMFFPSPFWITAAVWSALLNVLNLLPIQPLDGGRVLSAIAYSLRSTMGFVCTILILAGSIVFSLSFEFVLLYIFSLIGVAEFFKEYMARQRADKLALLEEHNNLTTRELLLLKSITGINLGVRQEPHIVEREKNTLKRLHMMLNAPRMNTQQIIRIGLSTVCIGILLFVFLFAARGLTEHAGHVIEIFR